MILATCPGCTDGATVGPLCATHRHEIDAIAARALVGLRARIRATAEAVYAEPAARYVECPRCEGHGDVRGEFHRHNPTGLVECPVCRGEREVPNPEAEAETNDNAALAQADAIDGAETIWCDLLDGDLTLDASLPCEHGYEVAS